MFYRKNLCVAVLTFTVFLMALFTNAQTIIVMLKQPPPNQWNVEDLWQLTLTNTSQEAYNVYLYGTVEEAGAGLIFEGTKGKLMAELFGTKSTLLPTKKMKEVKLPKPTVEMIKNGTDGHQQQ